MATSPSLPPFAAVVVAGGKGERARQDLPKQFARWHGKPLLRHSVEAFRKAGATTIVVAIPEGCEELSRECLIGIERVALAVGAATRQGSVAAALKELNEATEFVLIHDAARPIVASDVVARLFAALGDHDGAIPVLPVVDSLARSDGATMTGIADREELRRVQTPQAFRLRAIQAAHANWDGDRTAGDDAQVLSATGATVAVVEGDERLHKVTYADDFRDEPPVFRIGNGFDVHRLADGEELWLGGVRIPHDRGLAGHSDADVALHAITDAVLGALAQGDIGTHFPPSDEKWRGASSDRFFAHAVGLADQAGYRVGNIDLTIICEAPKIGPYRDAIQERIAEIASVDIGRISVKATTTEKLGFTGRGEGIAAQATALLQRY